jgi:SAM-dependent methyltransferase
MAVQSRYVAVARKFWWSLRRRGVTGTLKVALGRLGLMSKERSLATQATHPFDLKFGVDTSRLVDGTDLLTGHRHDAYNTAYWGVSPSRAREALRRWQESLQETPVHEYTFIDIGCGKGRMVLIASELPFREAIGVELNSGLAAIAAENAAKWTTDGHARCPIRMVERDATEMELPDGPCLAFLQNPFGAVVLRKLLARFEAQFAGRPEELDILYLQPEFEAVFLERGGYELVWKANFPQTDADEPKDVVAPGAQPCNAYRR